MNSSWLGIFRKYDNGWIFHARLGWLYLSDDGQDGLWFWMESQGWVWTQAEVYPFLWKQQSLDWLYLLPSLNDGNSLFFDYRTGNTYPVK